MSHSRVDDLIQSPTTLYFESKVPDVGFHATLSPHASTPIIRRVRTIPTGSGTTFCTPCLTSRWKFLNSDEDWRRRMEDKSAGGTRFVLWNDPERVLHERNHQVPLENAIAFEHAEHQVYFVYITHVLFARIVYLIAFVNIINAYGKMTTHQGPPAPRIPCTKDPRSTKDPWREIAKVTTVNDIRPVYYVNYVHQVYATSPNSSTTFFTCWTKSSVLRVILGDPRESQ